MVVKTFRGLLADAAVDRIRLSTIKGKVGYKIVKFQVIQESPGAVNAEATVTISKTTFTPVATVDFTDSDILGIAFYGGPQNAQAYPIQQVIIFDNEIINQDIFIGSQDIAGANEKMNYYLELEVIDLSDHAAEYTTLKDIRSRATT